MLREMLTYHFAHFVLNERQTSKSPVQLKKHSSALSYYTHSQHKSLALYDGSWDVGCVRDTLYLSGEIAVQHCDV